MYFAFEEVWALRVNPSGTDAVQWFHRGVREEISSRGNSNMNHVTECMYFPYVLLHSPYYFPPFFPLLLTFPLFLFSITPLSSSSVNASNGKYMTSVADTRRCRQLWHFHLICQVLYPEIWSVIYLSISSLVWTRDSCKRAEHVLTQGTIR